jgi:hypothetical protein
MYLKVGRQSLEAGAVNCSTIKIEVFVIVPQQDTGFFGPSNGWLKIRLVESL